MEGFRAQSCYKCQYKLDYCGHFIKKIESLRPSEAEIHIWRKRGHAQKGRGHFGIFRCTQKFDTRAKLFHNHLNELLQLSKLLDIEMHTGLWQALRVQNITLKKFLNIFFETFFSAGLGQKNSKSKKKSQINSESSKTYRKSL